MSYLDSMCHIASALEALAFFQTDMVRLRAIEVIAMSALSAYSLMHTDGDILNLYRDYLYKNYLYLKFQEQV